MEETLVTGSRHSLQLVFHKSDGRRLVNLVCTRVVSVGMFLQNNYKNSPLHRTVHDN